MEPDLLKMLNARFSGTSRIQISIRRPNNPISNRLEISSKPNISIRAIIRFFFKFSLRIILYCFSSEDVKYLTNLMYCLPLICQTLFRICNSYLKILLKERHSVMSNEVTKYVDNYGNQHNKTSEIP